VRRYKDKNRFAADIVDEIGDITVDGIDALRKGDIGKLGGLMTRDHKLLSILGVSCNELNKLVDASLKHSYGAKLTGAGGGGSMVALTDEPEKVCESITLHGGRPFVVRTGVPGARIEDPARIK
jgi:mevalonate kinase